METPKDAKKEKIGEYEILGKPIASGGMAKIYKVCDEKKKVYVAKVLMDSLRQDRRKKSRFLHEYECLNKVSDVRIIKALDVVDTKTQTALILEYVDGWELEKFIKKSGNLDEREALFVVYEVCSALEKCHQAGVIHRDLKLSNIMVDKKGNIRVLDFGVVRDMDVKRTLPGTVLGTIDYMAPEQIEGSLDEVDHRADFYSLGVVFFHLCKGKLPVRFTSSDSIVQILAKKKKVISRIGQIEDPVLDEFYRILMHPKREQRPVDCKDILRFITDYESVRDLKAYWKGNFVNRKERIENPSYQTKKKGFAGSRKILGFVLFLLGVVICFFAAIQLGFLKLVLFG